MNLEEKSQLIKLYKSAVRAISAAEGKHGSWSDAENADIAFVRALNGLVR